MCANCGCDVCDCNFYSADKNSPFSLVGKQGKQGIQGPSGPAGSSYSAIIPVGPLSSTDENIVGPGTPTQGSYSIAKLYSFVANFTNPDASVTINVDGLGVLPIYKNVNGTITVLVAGDIQSGNTYTLYTDLTKAILYNGKINQLFDDNGNLVLLSLHNTIYLPTSQSQKTIFVDGNGLNEAFSKKNVLSPFKTIEGTNSANSLASSGDSIKINSGNYAYIAPLFKDGVNYYFDKSSFNNPSITSYLIDDTVAKIISTIRGNGGFTNTGVGSNDVILLQNVLSNVDFEFDYISKPIYSSSNLIKILNGATLRLKGNLIDFSNANDGIWNGTGNNGGNLDIIVTKILGKNGNTALYIYPQSGSVTTIKIREYYSAIYVYSVAGSTTYIEIEKCLTTSTGLTNTGSLKIDGNGGTVIVNGGIFKNAAPSGSTAASTYAINISATNTLVLLSNVTAISTINGVANTTVCINNANDKTVFQGTILGNAPLVNSGTIINSGVFVNAGSAINNMI